MSADCICGHSADWHSHDGKGDCEHNADCRCAAFDRGDCTNGPDEHGNWPCDPKVLYGDDVAECQACGRLARWRGARLTTDDCEAVVSELASTRPAAGGGGQT